MKKEHTINKTVGDRTFLLAFLKQYTGSQGIFEIRKSISK